MRAISMLSATFIAVVSTANTADSQPIEGANETQRQPLVLESFGSFHIGGELIEITGQPVREIAFVPGGVPARIDPNGKYMAGQVYTQYFIPHERSGRYPLMMWHGGGLTGVTWENTPDGREGWLHYFLRAGWPVYVSDAVERGRSGFASPDIFPGEPLFLTIANPYERFRIGQGAGSFSEDPAEQKLLPGNQFPVEAYMNFVRQGVPRWTTTEDFVIDGYTSLLNEVGDSIIMAHSQSGLFALRVAQRNPELVKALVLVEPSSMGDGHDFEKLAQFPILVIYGDYIEEDERWIAFKELGAELFDSIRDAGGEVDVVDLPEDRGIEGNSHMIMMDKNSDQVAGVIEEWLVEQGLTE